MGGSSSSGTTGGGSPLKKLLTLLSAAATGPSAGMATKFLKEEEKATGISGISGISGASGATGGKTGASGMSGMTGSAETGLGMDPKVIAAKAKVTDGKKKLEELEKVLDKDLPSESREKLEQEKEALNRSVVEEEAEVNVTKAKRKAAKDEDKLRGLKDAARNESNPVKKKLLQKIAAQQQNFTDIAEAETKKVEAEDALRKLMAATGGISKKLLEEQRMAVVNATQALNKTVKEEKPKVLDLVGRSEVSVLHPDEGGPKSGVEVVKHFKKRDMGEMVNVTVAKVDGTLPKPPVKKVVAPKKAPCVGCLV